MGLAVRGTAAASVGLAGLCPAAAPHRAASPGEAYTESWALPLSVVVVVVCFSSLNGMQVGKE